MNNNILHTIPKHSMLIRTYTQLIAEVEMTRPQTCRKTHRKRVKVCTGMNRISIPTNGYYCIP